MSKKVVSTWKLNLSIYTAYTLITIIVTYPAITGLIYRYTIPGGGYDSTYFLWHLWWVKHAILTLGVSPTFTKAMFYPMGGVLLLASPFNELASLSLQPLLGLTRTYSFLWLFSFPTAGFTTYLLGYYFTHNRWAAFTGGLIFSFSAYHYAHAIEHLGLWTIQWLPLYALALYLLLKKPSLKRATFTTASFILAVTSDHVYYVFYFVIPITGLFLAYHWITKHVRLRQRSYWLAMAGALLVGILLVFPIYPHLLKARGEEFIERGDILFRSPDMLGYFIPANQHPTWHRLVSPLYDKMENLRTEGTVFIGYAATILMLLALWKQRNEVTRFWAIFGVLAFIFSLGPILYLAGPIEIPVEELKTYIPLPYILVINAPVVNLLRAPARLAVVVQLAVAILATYGAATIARRWPIRWRAGGFVALGIFILFESLYQFPYPVANTSLSPPSIYEQIAQEKNRLAVLEIPSRAKIYTEEDRFIPVKSISRNFSFYLMYYATIHERPILGGESGRTPPTPAAFIDTTMFIRELMFPTALMGDTPAVIPTNNDELIKRGANWLAKHNIGYVIVHRNLLSYIKGPERSIPELALRQSLGDPFYDDKDFIGFRVPQKDIDLPTDETFILGDGWYPTGNLYNHPVQGMLQTGTLLIYEPEPTMMRLSITAFTTMPNNATVMMSVNDALIETFQVPPTSANPKIHFTRAFSLTEGLNEMKFEVQHIDPSTQPLDPRAYLGVFDITPHSILRSTDVSPMYQQRTNLGDKIELIGYDLNVDTIRGGEMLNLTIYWHALAQMDDSYKVFIHVLDQQGNRIAQYDAIPHNWMLPTTAWGHGEVIIDEYSFTIPPDIPPGQYQIWTGMYSIETLQRLKVHGEDGSTVNDSVCLVILRQDSLCEAN